MVSDNSHRQQRRTDRSATAGRKQHQDCPPGSAGPPAAAMWPQRPDPSIISNAIPLFFIAHNGDGSWIAREADGAIGGIFVFRRSALRFARKHSEGPGCALMFLSQPFVLDIENNGNQFAIKLTAMKRAATRIFLTIRNIIIATAPNLFARLSRSAVEWRRHRSAIERDIFRGQYKYSTKNDDDLPIVY